MGTTKRAFATGALLCACLLLGGTRAFAQDIVLSTNASGISIAGIKPLWSTGFGSVNGLGLGTPAAGLTILTPSGGGGVLYTSPYNIIISGASFLFPAVVRGVVTVNFLHPSVLQVYSCTSSCTNGANYTPMSTNPPAPSNIIGPPGISVNQTVTRYLAVFVSDQNGSSAFTGTDSATITLLVYDATTTLLHHTYTLTLNNPSANVQTALSLVLATASGGRTISSGSDFSLAYGAVNALGISPGAGLTATSVSGGQLYSTPYLLQPVFSGFLSTSGVVQAHVSTDFVHPLQLELRDSSNGSSFSAISKSSASPTTLVSPVASGSTLTRYLGLFVSGINGATVFSGNDNATVTFTLVVP